jgi:hypothetical protein
MKYEIIIENQNNEYKKSGIMNYGADYIYEMSKM